MEGMEVYNEMGSVQFNTMARNLAFKYKGTHSVSARPSPAPSGTTRSLLEVNAETPILAFRPGTGSMIVSQIRQIEINLWWYYIIARATPQVDYWVFDAASVLVPGSYGLNVFDQSGRLTFSSAARPLKITGFNIGPGSQIAAPADKQYALVQGGLSGYATWEQTGGDTEQPVIEKRVYWDAMQTFGNGVQVQSSLLDHSPDTQFRPNEFYNYPSFLAVDVTNL